MTTTFTGPDACVECGSELNPTIALTVGVSPAWVEIRGHHVEVPGLYRCVSCNRAVLDGQDSKVDLDSAFRWLEDYFGPMMTEALFTDEDAGPELAAIVLNTMEITNVLELVIDMRDSGRMDEIPECTCGHEHGGQDRSKAELS